MRIAVRPDGLLHVAVAVSGWRFVEEDKTCRMKFVFGNGTTYEEELKAADVGSEIVLVKPRMSAPFLSDFMEKTSLRVHCRLNISRRAARPVRPLRGLPRRPGSPRKTATGK
jgi:hypothetical protein